MKRAYFLCLFLCLTTAFLLSQSNPVPRINQTAKVVPSISASPAGPQAQARILDGYGKLPLSFEANQGQADARVKFLSRTSGYSLFLTTDEAVLALRGSKAKSAKAPSGDGKLRSGMAGPMVAPTPGPTAETTTGSVLRMKLRNANPAARVTGVDKLAGTSNYFIGNDPVKWRSNIPTYGKVRYEGIYPGIDLVYYGNQRGLEYDFVLQPGADPGAIRLGIEGASRIRLDHGDLVLSSTGGEVRLRHPHTYQEVNGRKQEIHGRYVMNSRTEVGFFIASYDRGRALVIDPVLAYSTYLGGSRQDNARGIAVDSVGNAYVTGDTTSSDFPTVDAIQPTHHGPRNGSDAFVTKINANGTELVYSTYLGGACVDVGEGIALDAARNAYVTGYTCAADFPTFNAIQPTRHGIWNPFVTKINASGSALVYSTYLGGSGNDQAYGIAVDSAGNAYVTGSAASSDFPTVNAIQPTNHGPAFYGDAFVSKINANGTELVYSTYLGGSVGGDRGQGIAVDAAGNAYVTGGTSSTDFPTANAIQPTNHGGYEDRDAFVTKINTSGSALVYSTYLGGSEGDSASGIAVDSAGNAYITGSTGSTDFPTANASQPTNHGGLDAFVTKINVGGSAIVYSTYLGGGGYDLAYGIAVDSAGNAYATGSAASSDFPTVNAIQPTNHGPAFYGDAFVSKINANGTELAYSTYLGGSGVDYASAIAVDSAGSAYITGHTKWGHFPTTILAFQQSFRSDVDTFVTKIASQTFITVSPLRLTFPKGLMGATSAPKMLTLTNTGSSTLTLNKVYVAGKNAGDFGETNNCPATLAAGGICNIWVTFTPTGKSTRQGALGVMDSDPASPQAIPLAGTGTVVSLSATSLPFAKQLVGTTSAPKNVTLTNVGSTPLNFTSISVAGANPGDFLQTNTCGTSISGGASCTISVRFTPKARGSRPAALAISDDGGGSPQRVSLTGTGTVVSLSPTTLSFGDQTVGTPSAPKDVTLTNVGSTPLNFTRISVTGANPGDFLQTNTCGTSISGGVSCTISVRFKPKAGGARSAALTISDDGGGSPQKVGLTGKGNATD